MSHTTEYEYATPVELAAHTAHLRPRTLPWQRVARFAFHADPVPNRVRWGTDHFGNALAWLFLDRAHPALTVSVEALVDVDSRTHPAPPETPPWEEITHLALAPDMAREVAEFTFGSPMAPISPALRAFAAPSFPPGRPVAEGALHLMARIGREFRFDPEITTVSTPVERVLHLQAGVCQDFAHLMIAALRSLGLPARYVSGYLRTVPPPGQARLRGADHSHAWIACWLGPAHGWIDLDPTNTLVVADQHVWLAWGRDYADVSPVRGVILGGGRHSLRVSVDIEPAEVGTSVAADCPGPVVY